MSDGQARVLGLLIVLGLLEAAIHPAVKAFVRTAYQNISTNVVVKN
jgi:hypothetical protein